MTQYIENDLDSCLSMLDGQGPSAGRQVERAHTLIEKLEERMDTIEDLLDQLVDMVPQVQEDAEKKKQEVHKQISRVRDRQPSTVSPHRRSDNGLSLVPLLLLTGLMAGELGPGWSRSTTVSNLKKLTPEFTPAEFEAWKRGLNTWLRGQPSQ